MVIPNRRSCCKYHPIFIFHNQTTLNSHGSINKDDIDLFYAFFQRIEVNSPFWIHDHLVKDLSRLDYEFVSCSPRHFPNIKKRIYGNRNYSQFFRYGFYYAFNSGN